MYFSWRDILILIAAIMGILYLTFLAAERGLVVSRYWWQLILGLLVGWQIVFYFAFRRRQ